jgi:signal transduction histidine kinase/CheY-like chemotaxis protein
MALDPVRAKQKVALDPLSLSVPIGSRIAYLYHGQAGRTRFAAFIASGLVGGDKCVIVTNQEGKLAFETALQSLGIDVAAAQVAQALIFLAEQVPVDLIEKITQPIADDARRRFRSIRCLNDSCCAITSGYTARDLLRLEVKGHLLGNTFPTTFICQYDLSIVKRERIAPIISAHQYSVSGTRVEHNPDRRSLGQIIFDGMDEQLRALTRLQDLSLELAGSLSLNQTLDAVMDAALMICRTDRIAISYFDESGELKLITHRGLSEEYVKERRVKYDDPSVAALIATGEPLIIEDVDELAGLSPNYDSWKGDGVRSIVSLPLISEGEIFGVIGTGSGVVRHYSQTEADAMAILAAQAGAAITNARLFDQLTQANHAKDEFLATLSHELRTPLTPILGWIRILSRFADADPLLKEGFEVIERNARQQATLINDLLDLTRIDAGKIDLDREPTDLAHLMRTAVNLVRPQAENRAIRIHVQGPEEPVVCNVDPLRIQQVMLNLLSNAVKFTPDGGQVSASLELRRDLASQPSSPEEVAIRIVDTGIGISPDFLPYVFERFSQANGGMNRRYGGLGLGLAITRALVQLHGGTLYAESDGIDRGSCFTVSLPASVLVNMTATDPKHPQASSQHPLCPPRGPEGLGSALSSLMIQPPEAPRSGQSAARIASSAVLAHKPDALRLRFLIVEDSVDTLNMLTTWLRSLGSDVRAASNAAQALALAADYKPSLVISDIGMPDVDGYEFIRQLRKTPGLENVPAIALTGYAREEDREMALAAGYDAHLAKPAQMGHLLSLVKKLAGKLEK